jgi:hypothetical protein
MKTYGEVDINIALVGGQLDAPAALHPGKGHPVPIG